MCPFFKELLEIIQALEEYLRNAHKQMIVPTKESIMWIVLLQSWQFALGKINLLCEFSIMHKDLCAKQVGILYSEMSSDLLTNSEPDIPTSSNKEPASKYRNWR